MEVKDTLFMNKGDGENSYAHNSGITQKVASWTKPALEETVRSIISGLNKPVLNVADLGCAAGPNIFSVMSTVLSTVEKIYGEMDFKIPEIQFYLNDLDENDFNTLFSALSGFGERGAVPYFVMGAPGSFHGRLFPENSMDLIHSSYSVHWLTKVPKLINGGVSLNKGNIYVSKTSPPSVRDAYISQFREDFTLFLNFRSQEMVPNGRMILIIHATILDDQSVHLWDILTRGITQMIAKGLIDEEKLDSFDVPYYSPTSEVVRDLVDTEGSFEIEYLETFTLDNKVFWSPECGDAEKIAEIGAKNLRAFSESTIAYQFGQNLMDELYDKFVKNILMAEMSERTIKVASIMIVLRKIV